jgi:Domain of unknown function (DUF4333)
MRSPHDPNTTTSPEPPALPRRWLGSSLVAAVLVAASLAFTACGSSGAPTILNTEKIERAIEHSSLAQRGKHAQVSCPSGVDQKKGLVFSCTAVVARDSTRFVVTELDGFGHVHYEAP